MKRLVLMQGIPGSGKSLLAKYIAQSYCDNESIAVSIRSTDALCTVNGVYKFDPRMHAVNKQLVEADMVKGVPVIIVDNANIQKTNCYAYLKAAKVHGYEVQIIRVTRDLKDCIKDNAHKVPEDLIATMKEKMEDLI